MNGAPQHNSQGKSTDDTIEKNESHGSVFREVSELFWFENHRFNHREPTLFTNMEFVDFGSVDMIIRRREYQRTRFVEFRFATIAVKSYRHIVFFLSGRLSMSRFPVLFMNLIALLLYWLRVKSYLCGIRLSHSLRSSFLTWRAL